MIKVLLKRQGFTLIELLITMSFVGVISIIITTAYVTGYSTFKQELATSVVQSDGQTILDSLMLDIKNGMLIEPPTYSALINGNSYTTNANTIIVRVPAVDSNKQIIYSGTNMLFDRMIYSYDGSSIHKIILAEPSSTRYIKNEVDKILDRNVLELSFIYDPDENTATHVTATIHSSIKAGNKQRDITLTGEARLRNHI